MNTNKITFGKTIQINAPLNIAQRAANLINAPKIKGDETSAQKQLKDIFNDTTKDGEACAYTTGNPYISFIVSGKESEIASKYYTQMMNSSYNTTVPYSRYTSKFPELPSINAISEYNKQITSLINKTKENIQIQVEYDEFTKHIHSINLIK